MCQSEWPSLSEQITSMTQGTLIRKDRGPKGHNPAGWQDPGLPFASRAHGWKHQGTWNYYDRDLWSKTNIAHMVSVWRSPPLNICKHAFVNQVTITILCALLCPKYFDIRDRYQLHISWRNWNTNVFWQYSIHRCPRVHMEGRSRRSSSLRHCFRFFRCQPRHDCGPGHGTRNRFYCNSTLQQFSHAWGPPIGDLWNWTRETQGCEARESFRPFWHGPRRFCRDNSTMRCAIRLNNHCLVVLFHSRWNEKSRHRTPHRPGYSNSGWHNEHSSHRRKRGNLVSSWQRRDYKLGMLSECCPRREKSHSNCA